MRPDPGWALPVWAVVVVLRREVVGDLLVVAALTGSLLVWLDAAVVQADRQVEPSLGPATPVVVLVFAVAVLGWAMLAVPRRYRRPVSA